MARSRLFDVSGHERRPAGAGPALRLNLEPQFRGPARPWRTHASDEPRHGRRSGHRRPPRGCAGVSVIHIPISITSDFICPWCFIGERRLARAGSHLSRELDEEVHLDISWGPFELNPDFPPEGIDRRAYRIAKFGSWENSQRLDARVVEAGKPDGAVFNYDRITRTPNTRRAHRLIWWASHTGHNTDGLAERLFLAYFTEGRDLASCAVLAQIAASTGLDERATAVFLDTAEGTNEIVAAEADAYRRGVHGVPDFRIGSISFSGAQPLEIMAEALRAAAAALS